MGGKLFCIYPILFSSYSFSFPTFSLFIVRGWKRNVCGGEKSCEAVASSSSSPSDMRVVA